MTLKISPFALTDLEDSIEYYNLQKENLENNFAKDVNNIFERIKENPFQFHREYKEMRKAKLELFPFLIFFINTEKGCYILGIFHSSRNPKIMKSRYNTI